MGFTKVLLNIRSNVPWIENSHFSEFQLKIVQRVILLATEPTFNMNTVLLLQLQVERMIIDDNYPSGVLLQDFQIF